MKENDIFKDVFDNFKSSTVDAFTDNQQNTDITDEILPVFGIEDMDNNTKKELEDVLDTQLNQSFADALDEASKNVLHYSLSEKIDTTNLFETRLQ